MEYHVRSLVKVSTCRRKDEFLDLPGENAQEPSEAALLRLCSFRLHQRRVGVQRLSPDDRVDAIGLIGAIEAVQAVVKDSVDLDTGQRPRVRHSRDSRSVSMEVRSRCRAVCLITDNRWLGLTELVGRWCATKPRRFLCANEEISSASGEGLLV